MKIISTLAMILAVASCEITAPKAHTVISKKRVFTFDCSQYNEDICLFEAGQKCGSDYHTKWINHNDATYAISVECK